jgi:hypothetical protein
MALADNARRYAMLTTIFNELNLDLSSRVLFVHHGSLLDDCVLSLVGSNMDLDVVKVNYVSDEYLTRDIMKHCSDIVMMCQERTGILETLLCSLDSNPALEKLRVIVFHANDNSVDVYGKRHMNAIPSMDFLAMVRGAHAAI